MDKKLSVTFIGKYTIKCSKCGRIDIISSWAIAQLASGNDLIYSCKSCSEELDVLVEDFNNQQNES